VATLQFNARDTDTIRDGFLRTIRLGHAEINIDANVTPGSDWYIQGQAFANQLVVAEANAVIKADQIMPDSAEGDDLKRIAANFGQELQAAGPSVGPVVFVTSADTTITLGDKLIDGAGLTFKVTSPTGTYSDGDTIQVEAVDKGAQTNHDEGDILRWVVTPPFADEKVTVGVGGLVDGVDEEDIETLRARLQALLQSPPSTGNPEHVCEIAEASSPAVHKAFVFSAIQEAGTVHVATPCPPTDTNKTRELDSTILTSVVTPYIQAALPANVYSVITTVNDVNADVAFGLTLPEAPTASPPGPGGGWLDGTPWPAPDGVTTFRCTVTGVTSTTQFTVDATTAPTPFVTRISWLSPTTWTLYTGKVVAVSGSSGAYLITLDTAFVGISTGSYIWPACQNAQAYIDAVLGSFKLMGPGEKTTNASLLIRAHRHPRPGASWPYSLGGHLPKAITDAQSEVSSAAFLHRTDGTTTITGANSIVNPQVPATVTDPPNIFVPRHLAFYRTV
jgi:hypothetical protein